MASSVDSQRGSVGEMNLTSGISRFGSVEHVGVVVLDAGAALGVPAALHDLVVDRVSYAQPPHGGLEAAVASDPDCALTATHDISRE